MVGTVIAGLAVPPQTAFVVGFAVLLGLFVKVRGLLVALHCIILVVVVIIIVVVLMPWSSK
jgi:hypothetical protein